MKVSQSINADIAWLGKQEGKTGTRLALLCDMAEKKRTRKLYQQAFEDSRSFVDYYYAEKCRDNRIAVLEENGETVSMIHLNPYRLMVDGMEWAVTYLVAGATEKTRRGKGYYRNVIDYALDVLAREGQPFCYLMPAEVQLYCKLGFEIICDFDWNQDRSDAEIEREFDIYCVRDEVYRKRMEMEAVFESNPHQAVIMAHILNKKSFCQMSGLLTEAFAQKENRAEKEISTEECISWLRRKRIYLCEEV